MSTRKPHPLISDKIIRFFFAIIVFSALISGGTYYLQSSLLILQVMGLSAHWAAILILLPALSGLVQHLIFPPARLIVALLGSLASTTILYPLYAERFWAVPPSTTDTIVYTLIIAGIGFTSSINPLDRHVHQRRASGRRKKSSKKHESLLHVLKKTFHTIKTGKHKGRKKVKPQPHKDGLAEGILNSSIVRSFELFLTVLSFFLAIWGTFSLGMSTMN